MAIASDEPAKQEEQFAKDAKLASTANLTSSEHPCCAARSSIPPAFQYADYGFRVARSSTM